MRPQKNDNKELHTSGTQLRERSVTLRTTRRAGALGLPELIALGIAALFLVGTLAAYFLFLVPQRTRLTALGQERERLERRQREAEQSHLASESTNALVANIVDSLDKFETGALADRDASSTGIIEELNEKTAHNGLARAQFSFTHQDELTLEQLQQQQQRLAVSSANTGNETAANALQRKRQSVFPGIDISLTVEGSYANLRHFIHDVETSRRFIVINGIELESVSDASGTRAAESKVERGQLVSLRLDMSAYFRRTGMQPSGDTTGAPAASSH